MENSGLVALVDLAECSGVIQLESATEECLSMGQCVQLVRASCYSSSTLIQLQRNHLTTYVSPLDMWLIWQLTTPTSDGREAWKHDGSEYRWSTWISALSSSHATLKPMVKIPMLLAGRPEFQDLYFQPHYDLLEHLPPIGHGWELMTSAPHNNTLAPPANTV